ncbi:MAG: simple sugar transport system substrate-binding protein [Thermoanaerobaculia bacterium]|jgi:simple sugar transport system substrate-binding protein|nr:simple sugar transport system substrate-binding protein [Thermoanaerobaculia bacterium]
MGEVMNESGMNRRRLLQASLLGGAGLLGTGVLAGCAGADAAPSAVSDGKGSGWAKGMNLKFFAGGGAGDLYASVVVNGAKKAAQDLGCKIDFVYSNWDPNTAIRQLSEIIATKPDGIAMDGSPGDDAIMPLAARAAESDVTMTYWDVDVPKVRKAYGGGYAGADLYSFGFNLATQAAKEFGLGAGDGAVVYGFFASTGFGVRDNGVAEGLEKAGVDVTKITMPVESGSNPQSITPIIAGGLAKNPNTKLISLSGGQWVGTSPAYLKAAGKKPGEVKVVGFDFLPSVIDAMNGNWAQMTAVMQPYLQGYLSVLSLCLTRKWHFQPLVENTATGYMTQENYKTYVELAKQGIAG